MRNEGDLSPPKRMGLSLGCICDARERLASGQQAQAEASRAGEKSGVSDALMTINIAFNAMEARITTGLQQLEAGCSERQDNDRKSSPIPNPGHRQARSLAFLTPVRLTASAILEYGL